MLVPMADPGSAIQARTPLFENICWFVFVLQNTHIYTSIVVNMQCL